ncbi:MAG: hypothetical protein NXH97_19835 [Rhodobacteraceae bacterium]|nr:hypothetical protein [Paracoccaceae bacterium]
MVLVETPFLWISATVYYDQKNLILYQWPVRKGVETVAVPVVFIRPNDAAHSKVFLRARAIETGCFMLAAAQTGTHRASAGKIRETWGHIVAVSPWDEVLPTRTICPVSDSLKLI